MLIPRHPQRPTIFALALTLALGLFAGSPARAEWTADGDSISVWPCEELPTASVSDGAGGAYIVWSDKRTCDITQNYVQRILGSGRIAPGWPVGGLPVAPGTVSQGPASAVTDGANGLIVGWSDGRTGVNDVYAQRIGPDAKRLWSSGGVRACDAGGAQDNFTLSADGKGGAFLAWSDWRRGIFYDFVHPHRAYDLYAQRLDRNGARVWPVDGAPVETLSEDYAGPALQVDGADGVWVVWVDRRVATYAQRLDPSGAPRLVQDGIAINGGWIGNLTGDGANGFILAFEYGGTGSLYVQRVDSTGAERWGAGGHGLVSVPLGLQPTSIAQDGDGGAYVAWHDERNGKDWDVFVLRVTADAGTPSPGWPVGGLPVCAEPNFQIYPHLTTDGSGGCIAAWYDIRDSSTAFDVYAQRILPGGTTAPGWSPNGVPLCRAPGDQEGTLLLPDGTGGAIVTWSDYRFYADVYAQRVDGAGVVGASSMVVGVPPGATGVPRLALATPWPNPLVRGAPLRVSFDLPRAGRAELDVFDVRGRRVARRTLEAAPAGPQSVALDGSDMLAPGVYVVQLAQGPASVARKFTVAH